MYYISRCNLLLFITTLASSSVTLAGQPPTEPILRLTTGEHNASITSIATDKAGRWLVTASDQDKIAMVWNLADGQLSRILRIPIDNKWKTLTALALSPDGKIVALGGQSFEENDSASFGVNAIYLFDRTSGKLLRRIAEAESGINSLAFSSDGRTLAATFSEVLRLYSVADGHKLAEDRDQYHYRQKNSVSFSTDGRLVTSDGRNLRLYRFDKHGLTQLAKNPDFSDMTAPMSLRFSPDGKHIAWGFRNDNYAIKPHRGVKVLDVTNLEIEYKTKTDKTAPNQNIYAVAWSHDGEYLYAAGETGAKFGGEDRIYIRRWLSAGKGEALDMPIPIEVNSVSELVALPKGRLAFAGFGGAWGVLNSDGSMQYFHAPQKADFNGLLSDLTLSRDASVVGFSYQSMGDSPAVFDSKSRSFVTTDTSELFPPQIESTRFTLTDWKNTFNPKLNGTLFIKGYRGNNVSLAIAHDGNSFVLGGTNVLTSFDNDGTEKWTKGVSGVVWGVNMSQDGRWVVAALGDGTIRWHRASDGVEQLAFFPHADRKRWIMWTPEGYYDASPGAEDLIGWHLNQGKDKEARFIPSGQLYDVFFRPDIVQAKFRGEDISSMITITAAQALKMPPPILSFTKVPSKTKLNKEKVCYKAVATGGGIGEVRLFQNGKLIKSDGFYRESVAKVNTGIKLASNDSATVTRALKLTKTAQNSEPPMVSNSKGNEYTECQEIETIPGDNEISVAAFNANNTIQSALETAHFTADRKAEAPHLYVLGIGIDQYTASENNLKYAVKDAADFRGMIQDKTKGLFDAQNIHIEGLNDAQATKAGIQQAIASISAKVKPWDSFVLFVASHGYLQDNQYYIVTSDFDGTIDTTKMISSNEIVGMSKNIKSLSQLLIFDTCHAGGVDNIIGGLYDARMSVMAKKMGLHIYASAGSTQTALDGYKGNGLFTHALLGSMKANTTDSNRDNEVSVAELGEQAKQETMAISTKLGFPQSPNIINFGKDNALFRVK